MTPTFTVDEFNARIAEIEAMGRLQAGPSLAEQLALTKEGIEWLESLSPLDAHRLLYDWEFWARPKQLAPSGKWVIWFLLGGRGTGKNRTAAEWVRGRIESGEAKSIALIGPTWKEVRRFMVGGRTGQGGSGLLDVFPDFGPDDPRTPRFIENKQEVHFDAYDAIAYLNTAEQKELRGANLDTIWWDELCKAKYARALFDNVEMTLRVEGDLQPQMVISTTPMPMAIMKEIIMDPGTHTTHAVTTENAANVAQTWLDRMQRRYAGTRQGQQELGAKILGDNPDAMFHLSLIEAARVDDCPDLVEVCVGVDPAVSTHRQSDAVGIVAAGIDADGGVYVLEDRTAKMSPNEWASEAVDLGLKWGADYFVVERNKVGDLAKSNLMNEIRRRHREDELIPKAAFREAYSSSDKASRATPVAGLYEQGRVHHVGHLGRLESEMTEWNPSRSKSPNGIDALCHAVYELCQLASFELETVAKDPNALWDGFAEAQRGFEVHGRERLL